MNRDVPLSGHAQPAGVVDRLVARLGWLFLVAILLALAVQFLLAFRIVVNWDEFHFLSFVYEHARGDPVGRFQTLHVHLFAWLPDSGATEIDEIVAGRFVMATLACGSAGLVYMIARRFLSRDAALFGLVAYLSLASTIQHASSLRTDPLATFLCLLALFLLLRRPQASFAAAALAGIVMAIAAMCTIKVVFYLVTIGFAMLCLAPTWSARLRLAIWFSIPFILAFAALFWLHGVTLNQPAAEVGIATVGNGMLGVVASFLQRTGSKMFLDDGLFPRWQSMLVSVVSNPLFWIVTVWGLILAWRGARTGTMREGWLALALAFPIATPLFYRNAFDYNFVFILPPGAVLAGLAFERLRERAVESGRIAAHLLLGVIVLGPCIFLIAGIARNLPDRIEPQRRLVEAVHQIFSEPVAYIDGYGVIARFPRAGFFSSTWGIDRYREADRPVYAGLVAATEPPFLLADSLPLHAALIGDLGVPDELMLLPDDVAFLATHYRQYWGMIFVAGQSLTVAEPGGIGAFDIVVAGDYRLESAGQVRIDGFPLQPGATVRLEAGAHEFRAGPEMTEALLRWADLGEVPEAEPVGLLEFFGVDRGAAQAAQMHIRRGFKRYGRGSGGGI